MSENTPSSSPAPAESAGPDDHAFRLLVQTVSDYAIFMLSPSGQITSWNIGAERLKGYCSREIIGRHFSAFYPAESTPPGWPEHLLQRAAEIGHIEDEGWRVRKDGTRFWANVVLTALRDESGRLLGYSKVTRDLTERRQHEERLKQSEERFRLLVEGVQDYAIFMLDTDGIIRSWNAGATRIKGYASSEIIGQSFTRFYSEEDVASGKPLRTLENARRYGSARDEGWRLRKDGSRFMANVVVTALYDQAGSLRGYAKFTRDLTQTKRIETLEAEGQRIYEFIAMLAHELRNPLAPIRNAVGLMATDGISAEKLEWCRDVIDRQSGHLARLVDDLLDISRITRGKITLNREEVDLAALINRGVETSLPLIQARRHRLNVVPADRPVRLAGDPTRLLQVVSNLLHNAAKYTPAGGTIDIIAAVEGSRVAIRVRDNGIGMPTALIDKVFDLFQQGDRALDRSEGGLGIGLTLVEQIVALHGGSVEAYSAGEGRGSEFTVWLPIPSSSAASTPAPGTRDTAAPETPGGLRVLVVDDNQDSANTMAMLIEALGHEAETVHDGSFAATVARRFRPDLVLLDIGLPGLDGFAVARQFKSAGDLRHIRLTAATGYGQAQDRERAREAGFDDFLVKPISLEQLREVMRQAGAGSGAGPRI